MIFGTMNTKRCINHHWFLIVFYFIGDEMQSSWVYTVCLSMYCKLFHINPFHVYTGGLFHCIYWKSPFVILGVLGLFYSFYSVFNEKS